VVLMLDVDPVAGRSEQIARRFAAALEAGDVDAALAATSPDVVFHSPVVHRPYEGRDILGAILRAVVQTFEDLRYTAAYGAEDGHVLAFAARVGDRALQGVDILHFGADGLIDSLAVMVRPYSAATALKEQMADLLLQDDVRPH